MNLKAAFFEISQCNEHMTAAPSTPQHHDEAGWWDSEYINFQGVRVDVVRGSYDCLQR